MAIIVKKDSRGAPEFKSLSFPPSQSERELAHELDLLLQRRIPEIENELIEKGFLKSDLPDEAAPARGGNIALWWNLGSLLKPIVEDERLVKPKERRFLWEALRMYATARIQRVDRGPSRVHWDYCYRVSKFPWQFVSRLNWDDWVFFVDSKSLRQEPRIDEWLQHRMKQVTGLNRQEFRTLARELNRVFKGKDTSVFSDKELFAIYDATLVRISK
jgi:hypothetical protein